jgi:hypothetical protein
MKQSKSMARRAAEVFNSDEKYGKLLDPLREQGTEEAGRLAHTLNHWRDKIRNTEAERAAGGQLRLPLKVNKTK